MTSDAVLNAPNIHGKGTNAIELPIDWNKAEDLYIWAKKDAAEVVKILKPLIGRKVLLYGGGAWLESHICKLEGVSIHRAEKKVKIQVRLTQITPRVFEESEFSPWLGSWRLAKLEA